METWRTAPLGAGYINLESDSKWFDVGGETWKVPSDCFIVPRTKNGKPRVIPLNGQARAIVKHQLGDVTIDRYLFPSTRVQKGEIRSNMIKEVKKGFAGACKAAGLKYGQYDVDGITFHTLRHRFNSKLDALGVSKSVRRDLRAHTRGHNGRLHTFDNGTKEASRRASLPQPEPRTIKFSADCGKICGNGLNRGLMVLLSS